MAVGLSHKDKCSVAKCCNWISVQDHNLNGFERLYEMKNVKDPIYLSQVQKSTPF